MSDVEKKEETKPKKIPRAQKFANIIKKGRNGLVKYQAYRKTPSFKRSKRSLLKLPRKPKVIRKSIEREKTWDKFSILLAPCSSERFYKKMENENTIIFYVSQKANKPEIKKAFIKLPKTNEASEIASKIGLI